MKQGFIKRLLLKKYNCFAEKLGYQNWDEALDHTFTIFLVPEDAGWYATELQNGSWAVWTDSGGEPPYNFHIFKEWIKAIVYLKNIFVEEDYPQICWQSEGYESYDKVFSEPPSKDKRYD